MALNDTKTKNDMQDIKYVEEAEESVSTETDADRVAEEKALVRKIDIALLPCIWIMYLLSYMDRTNIGNAKVAGMTEDLNMSSDQYSIALVVFFITYVVFEVPSNLILAKTKPSIFLPTIMFLWVCDKVQRLASRSTLTRERAPQPCVWQSSRTMDNS